MKKIIYFYLFFFASITTWSQNRKVEDKYIGANLCQILKKMNEKDQEKRKLMPTDPFFKELGIYVKDSLKMTLKEYSKLTTDEMRTHGKKIRKYVGKFPNEKQQKKIDSLMRLQILIDNQNTEQLIGIVKKRGYPNENNCECKIFPKTVFRHSQSKYWEEIRTLIEKEHREKRLDTFSYKLFLNHINGRKNNKIN